MKKTEKLATIQQWKRKFGSFTNTREVFEYIKETERYENFRDKIGLNDVEINAFIKVAIFSRYWFELDFDEALLTKENEVCIKALYNNCPELFASDFDIENCTDEFKQRLQKTSQEVREGDDRITFVTWDEKIEALLNGKKKEALAAEIYLRAIREGKLRCEQTEKLLIHAYLMSSLWHQYSSRHLSVRVLYDNYLKLLNKDIRTHQLDLHWLIRGCLMLVSDNDTRKCILDHFRNAFIHGPITVDCLREKQCPPVVKHVVLKAETELTEYREGRLNKDDLKFLRLRPSRDIHEQRFAQKIYQASEKTGLSVYDYIHAATYEDDVRELRLRTLKIIRAWFLRQRHRLGHT